MKQEKNKFPETIVGAFIFNDKDELFLIKSPKWGGRFFCPGGHIKLGETMEDALCREVKEETGLDLKEIEFLGVTDGNKAGKEFESKKHFVFLNFKARAKGKEKVKLNKETTEYKWLKVNEWLKENLVSSVKYVLEKYLLDNETYEHKYLRALADYQNLLKRSEEEKKDFVKYANENFLQELLPVYDNLKLAIKHSENEESHGPWFEGVKHVTRQFEDILNNLGVKEIETVGKKFDFQTMEAVEKEATDNKKEDGLVSKQLKTGYLYKDKVIIPARVSVKEYKNK